MSQTKTRITRRLLVFLGSPACFWLMMVLLILQAAWVALSGLYPMAFDEDFHLGIIRLYAHHISPFWGGQPAGGDQFGAVTRDPSYLYQYLMSFPYRLISLFTGDQTIQVLLLRAINIGLFTWGVTLYHKLLLKVGASRAIANTCLLVFVLVPITPFLAAQINYDNLFLPAVAITLLLALRFDERLVEKRRVDIATLGQLLIACLLASLVKYAFLPVFLAIGGFVLIRLWQYRSGLPMPYLDLAAGWRSIGGAGKAALFTGLIISGGLFGQRYFVNLVRYQNPVPDCSQVLSIKQCSAYGPWIRDYNFKINKLDTDDSRRNPLVFTADWFYGMWLRSFFTVAGPTARYETRGPLFIPGLSSVVFTVLAVAVTVAASLKGLLKRYEAPGLWLFVAVSVGYSLALWFDEYRSFVKTGQPVAINGRYLLPVLPLALVIAGLSANTLLRRRLRAKLALVGIIALCFLWGGGALTFALRSNDSWYWPNRAVRDANHAVQHVFGPVTPGYGQPTLFMH